MSAHIAVPDFAYFVEGQQLKRYEKSSYRQETDTLKYELRPVHGSHTVSGGDPDHPPVRGEVRVRRKRRRRRGAGHALLDERHGWRSVRGGPDRWCSGRQVPTG
ncbi:unnamed protein product [Parnassius apollo]|uniref:(apollo) hypothetical protein n=1 Tax=Parnassius apollo TaxID=110799 RepID=A0A8S3XN50_PARAO|nr:unnamed protein product [Parnassius apollo]